MKNLDVIAKDLFNKIRGRFPNITIGDSEGNVTNIPDNARYFDFAFSDEKEKKISVSLDENNGVVVIVGKDIVSNQPEHVQDKWYSFLKELRIFAKKRLLNFDVRDINKSNLNKRDYKFLAATRPGDEPMAESRMYGTNKTSYQRIGNARLAIKHSQPINVESTGSRSQKIKAIYIESPEGERFKYPFKHIAGARAMARHVSEGGNAYDDFGKYIAGLSEEASKLQKFKKYMGRSTVMAETLSSYMDTVNTRIQEVKKEIIHLQKESFYKEAVSNFTVSVVEDVPEDVAENWIDQLTIKQFNEELKDVFPYIYKLVGEATKAEDLGPDDLIDESGLQYYTGVKKHGKEYMKKAAQAGREGASQEELGRLKDKYSKAEKKTKEEFEIEQAFEDVMGQFSDHVCEDCGNPSWRTLSEEKQKGVDGKVCWKGYKRMGTKMKGGKRVDNCVKVGEATTDQFAERIAPAIKDRYRTDKNWTAADNNYNGFIIYVSKDKIANGMHVATAVSAATAREVEGVKTGANKAQKAVELIKQKLDARISSAKKVTADATLDFNVKFMQELSQDLFELGYDEGQAFYAKIDTGPVLVIANIGEFAGVEKLLRSDEKFALTGNRGKAGGNVMPSLRITAKKMQATDLVANGRYIIGNPKTDSDGHYVYSLQFDSIVNDKGDLLKFNKPAVTVGANRNESVDEGLGKKLAMLALLGLTGYGAMKATSPVNSPLGQALQQAAEQGDEDAAYHLKRLGAYIDAGDSQTLKQLNFQYIDEPAAMKDDSVVPNDSVSSPLSMSPKKSQTPLGEFILSYFDRETGKFPKGETAVLTAVQKDYGDQYVKPAVEFIKKVEAISTKNKMEKIQSSSHPETEMIKHLAGV